MEEGREEVRSEKVESTVEDGVGGCVMGEI